LAHQNRPGSGFFLGEAEIAIEVKGSNRVNSADLGGLAESDPEYCLPENGELGQVIFLRT
jgi:hypothetical protein